MKLTICFFIFVSLSLVTCSKHEEFIEQPEGREEMAEKPDVDSFEEENTTQTTVTETAASVEEYDLYLEAEINDTGVRLRDWTTLDSEVLDILNKGDRVKIYFRKKRQKIGTMDDYWYYVELQDTRRGYVYGTFLDIKKPAEKFMLLRDRGTITMEDIVYAGITDFTSISQILDKLAPRQIQTIDLIIIENANMESFKGLEQFVQLGQLRIRNSEMVDFTEFGLTSTKDIWLWIFNTKVESLKGLEDLKNIYLLSLEGSRLKEIDYCKLPQGIYCLALSNFSDYAQLLPHIPTTIEEIYFEDNNIKTIEEIEFLKAYSNLKRIYFKGNAIPLEVLEEEAERWKPKKLIFHLGDDGSL
ncbi:hypothetical protein AGMMS50293_01120 [Spirochaetia bacterium]|nr:hypothetical protein AGMMS50293_01120 [Spirochaetia bacterium]